MPFKGVIAVMIEMAEGVKNGIKIKPKCQMMLKSMMNLVDMYSNVVPNLVMSE